MACNFHYPIQEKHHGLYSDLSDQIIEFVSTYGYEVDMLAHHLGDFIAGRIFYPEDIPTSLIEVNSSCAGCMTLVLLHETGHLLCDMMILNYHKLKTGPRERLARRLGIMVGTYLGFDLTDDWINEGFKERYLQTLRDIVKEQLTEINDS